MQHHDVQAKRNFKLVIEYDGSKYHGWQRQQGALTIQEVLESCLEVMLQTSVRAKASGRTDAGVHARGQVVSLACRTRLRPTDILRGLNSLLPPDIVVLTADEMPDSFHARFSASSKTYAYRILNRPVPSALERSYSWHIPQRLCLPDMLDCLRIVEGEHDFAAFMASGSSVTSTTRRMFRADLERPDEDHLVFHFEATGFLRHMVRTLVGTVVAVGRGKLTPPGFQDILESKDRRKAGMTAPAHGLYLVCVNYDEEASSPDRQKGTHT